MWLNCPWLWSAFICIHCQGTVSKAPQLVQSRTWMQAQVLPSPTFLCFAILIYHTILLLLVTYWVPVLDYNYLVGKFIQPNLWILSLRCTLLPRFRLTSRVSTQHSSDRLLALLGSDILVALRHLFYPPLSGLSDLNQSEYTSGTRSNGWLTIIRIAHLSSDLEGLVWRTLRITGELWVFVDIWYKSNLLCLEVKKEVRTPPHPQRSCLPSWGKPDWEWRQTTRERN